MWSVNYANHTGANLLTINAYPGVFRVHGFTTGGWVQLPNQGGLRGCIISTWGVGVGGASRAARPGPLP
jgi:hypothetical protein